MSSRAAGAVALALAAGAALPAVATGAPQRVEAMVVGKTRVLVAARTVSVPAVSLLVAGRRCAIADATPLATLEILRRGGGPSFALKDFGRCSNRAADASQLYVSRVAGDREAGRDGWVYRVGRRVPSVGAADPLGPFGTGRRLRTGDRVTWFWCRNRAGGCQRQLEITPATSRAAPGAAVTIVVSAYDNDARARRQAGAVVRVGATEAVTGRDGKATITLPTAPGRLAVTATAAGLTPAFPAEVVVG